MKYAVIRPEEAATTGYDYNEVKKESARILWKPPMLDPQIQASVLLEAGSMHYIDQGGLEIIMNEDFIDRVVQGIQQGIARIEEKNCPTPTPEPTATPTPEPTVTPSPN